MTKAELISKIAKSTGASQAMAGKMLDITLSEVSGALKKGDSITFTGFGTFSVSNRAARQGRNPQTGAAMKIAASKVARFKPGKTLKDSLNGR